MAMLAAKTRIYVREILALLAPTPGKCEIVFRQTIICILTLLTVQLYGLPDPALTVYVVFYLTKSDRVSSMLQDQFMFILYTFIIGIVLIFIIHLLDEPIARVFFLMLFFFVIMFLTASSKLEPVGSIIALIVGYSMDLLTAAPNGEIALRVILYAWLFVAIPAAIALVVNMLFAPSPLRLAGEILANQLQFCANVLNNPAKFERKQFNSFTRKQPELQDLLNLASKAQTTSMQSIAALKQGSALCYDILLLTECLHQLSNWILPFNIRHHFSTCLQEMAAIFNSGQYPVEIKLENVDKDLPPILHGITTRLTETINAVGKSYDTNMQKLCHHPEKQAFFHSDAFSNADYVSFSLKTTASAMFCYFTYSLLDWRGIHTCMITCFIVALGTVGETVEKFSLRVIGCLIGAGLGLFSLLFIIPSLTSIGGLLILVFFVIVLASWVANSGPRISYAGFQIALAFLMTVVQKDAPAFDLTIPRDRIIGILFGNFTIFIVFTQFWPQTITDKVEPAIATLFNYLSRLILIKDKAQRMIVATAFLTELEKTQQAIKIAKYEPVAIRPSQRWLEQRQQWLELLNKLHGTIYLSVDEKLLHHQLANRLKDDGQAIMENNIILRAPKPMPFSINYPHLSSRQAFACWLYDDKLLHYLSDIENRVFRDINAVTISEQVRYEPA